MSDEMKTDEPGNGLLRGTIAKAGKVAEVAIDAKIIQKRVENAVEAAKIDAQRLARRGKYAVEEAIDDTAHRIRKEPWRSVGIVFGIGLGIGVLSGLLMARRPSRKG